MIRTSRQSLLIFLLFISVQLYSQQKYTLSGTIAEAASNETLIGVTIAVPELRTGVATNEYGFYSLTLPEGEYEVQISYLGYQDIISTISFTEDQKINFQLAEQAEQLDEVVLVDEADKINIRKPQMSVSTMAVQTIKKIPVVLGEADVI
ncbi:MAG TPA: carboxypeptidase-like regulatory domain-containing protein, partial [Eudoraea sp.]|nr:carboxypeptidase-like regulatory domain-containing protein [Eudoraea sp.]